MIAFVEVYNQGGTELHDRVSVEHAMKMLWRGVAVVREYAEGYFGPFEMPKSLMLVRYVYAKWKYQREGELVVTRRGILKRDKFLCAYCGKAASTIDHILPRSRGGEDSWMNLVAACLKCNNVKDDMTPKEARMKLLFEPRVPKFAEVYAWGKK